jgi:PAS domain S-box-containing protein
MSNDELRRLAHERSIVPSTEDAAALSRAQVHQLLEELAMGRVELEIQNEHLLDTHARLEWALGHARDLYDFAPVGCFSTTPQGVITTTNLSGARMLGLERYHLIQQEFAGFFCKSQRAEIHALIAQTSANGENQRCWLKLQDENLPCRYVQLDLAPLAQGEGCQMVMTDMTERQLQEDRTRDAEARWKFAIDTAGDGFWDWDVCMGHVFYSNKLKQLYGYGPEEFGTSLDAWRALVHPADQGNFVASIQQCLSGKQSHFSCNIGVLCKDNSWKWILCRGAVFTRNQDGKAERIIGTHTDITACRPEEDAVPQGSPKRASA